MASLSFIVPGLPVPQGSHRVIRGRVLESNAQLLRPWRHAITWTARSAIPAGWDNLGPMAVELRFCFPRPKAHYRASGQILDRHASRWKATRPDLDKLVRAVCDALSDAAVWADDSQLVHLLAIKEWGAAPMLAATVATARHVTHLG